MSDDDRRLAEELLREFAIFKIEYETHGLPGIGEQVLGAEATVDEVAAALARRPAQARGEVT